MPYSPSIVARYYHHSSYRKWLDSKSTRKFLAVEVDRIYHQWNLFRALKMEKVVVSNGITLFQLISTCSQIDDALSVLTK